MKDLLTNGTLNRQYARIILLSKEWWSEDVVVLRSECVNHVDCLLRRLAGLVLPPSVLLLFGHYCCLSGPYAFCG
jgi:hypothetical protein